MSMSPYPIEQSFELAALSCCVDLKPVVYQRLFNKHPMGSALALAIEATLDFADQRRGHFRPALQIG